MSQILTYTQDELIEEIRNRNQRAFSYLYDNYSKALYGIIYSILRDEPEAEDALQKTFLKIWSSFQTYDENKGRLYTWMLNIARNIAIDSTRSRHTKAKGKIQSRDEHVSANENAGFSSEEKTNFICFNKILEELKEDQKQVIDMAYFEGFTQEEIAQRLNMPLGTVKTKVRQAILKLRELTKNEFLR